MIQSLEIHPNDYTRKRLGQEFGGWKLDFEPGPNLIIGPNGSGKSTLFRALRAVLQGSSRDAPGSWAGFEFPLGSVQVTLSDGSVVESFSRERPRTAVFHDGLTDDLARAPMIAHGLSDLQFAAMRSSHGQGLIAQVGHAIKTAVDNNLALCLDEPDGCLDLKTVSTIAHMDALYERHGTQSIIISHHPLMLLRALTHGWRVFETVPGSAFAAALMMAWPDDVVGTCCDAVSLGLT